MGVFRRRHSVAVRSGPSGPFLPRVGPFAGLAPVSISSLSDITYSASRTFTLSEQSFTSPLKYRNITINNSVLLSTDNATTSCLYVWCDTITFGNTTSALRAIGYAGAPSDFGIGGFGGSGGSGGGGGAGGDPTPTDGGIGGSGGNGGGGAGGAGSGFGLATVGAYAFGSGGNGGAGDYDGAGTGSAGGSGGVGYGGGGGGGSTAIPLFNGEGGGAAGGGLVVLVCNTMVGAGNFRAFGGAGGLSDGGYPAGGGGGGVIWVATGVHPASSTVNVLGGTGWVAGGAGAQSFFKIESDLSLTAKTRTDIW